MIHNPVFWLIRETQFRVLGTGAWREEVRVGLAAVLTLVLADLNYRFFETPLRERGKKVAARFAAL